MERAGPLKVCANAKHRQQVYTLLMAQCACWVITHAYAGYTDKAINRCVCVCARVVDSTQKLWNEALIWLHIITLINELKCFTFQGLKVT